nr:hypothetical protein [Aquamicrobium sp. LC103]
MLQLIQRKPAGFKRIVTGNGFAGNPGADHRDKHVVVAKLPILVAIERVDGREDPLCSGLYSRLLAQLADCRCFDSLTHIDLAARKTPSTGIWRIGAPHQKHTAVPDHRRDRRSDRPRYTRIWRFDGDLV